MGRDAAALARLAVAPHIRPMTRAPASPSRAIVRIVSACVVAAIALGACGEPAAPNPKARPLAGTWTDTTAGVEAIAQLDSVEPSATAIQGTMTLRRLVDGEHQQLLINGGLLATVPDSLEATLYNATATPDEPFYYGRVAGHYAPRSITIEVRAELDNRFDRATFTLAKKR